MRQDDLVKNLPARSAQAGCSLFQLLLEVFEHWLHGTHHKRQADKDQRNGDALGVVGHLNAQRLEVLTNPAIARIQRRQGNTSHCRRQGKGQIDQRIHHLLAGELIAHQHPRDQHAKHHIHTGRDEGHGEGQLIRRHHGRRRDCIPELLPGQAEAGGQQGHQRDEHDNAQIKDGVAQRQPETGQHSLGATHLARSQNCRGHIFIKATQKGGSAGIAPAL